MEKIINMFKRHNNLPTKSGSLLIRLIKDPDAFTYTLKVKDGKTIVLTITKDE